MERSLRPHFALRRDVGLSRAHFLQSKGPALMGAVELSLATESAGAKLHRSLRRHYRQRLLFHNWRSLVFAGCGPAWIWRGKIISRQSARHHASSLYRSVHHIGCVLVAIANASFPRLESGL